MDELKALEKRYEETKQAKLNLNMERGQPGDADFDLSNPMLAAVTDRDLVTPSGIALRNYPGGVLGLPEARELFSTVLGVKPSEMLVAGNSLLKILADLLLWARVKGLRDGAAPWNAGGETIIVTTPGYDRHFTLLDAAGFRMVAVPMAGAGPDVDAVEKLAAGDPSVKGMVFVPTYSNPTGDVISDAAVERLAAMRTAADDFTIFADDAYAVHHLYDAPRRPRNLLRACEEAGNPDRVYLFGSTSKMTFAGAGIGFMATSERNLARAAKLFGAMYIGPDKIDQYRHVKFLSSFPGGIAGIMAAHARLLRPKFEAVHEVFARELSASKLASWTRPSGGYFISLDAARPVAKRVVELAKGVGVALTPAGATFPFGNDPRNTNIRIAPTRPPVEEVRRAAEVVALCVALASAEYDAGRR